MNIAPCGHGDRNRTQQNADQTGQTQESPGPLDRIPNLRACVRDVVNPLALLLVSHEPRLELVDSGPLSREQSTVTDATSGLNQLGCGEVGIVHQQGRGQLSECATLVGTR